MQEFLAWLSRVLNSWKFWVIIAPWETGVMVRLGRRAVALRPGIHWRIPFVDVITLVNTRLRIDATPAVTVPALDKNRTKYISAVIGYRVADPLKAMMRFGFLSPVVVSKTQSEIAATQDEGRATAALRAYFDVESGIEVEFVRFVENVEARTYRLINGGAWVMSGHESVETNGAAGGRY